MDALSDPSLLALKRTAEDRGWTVVAWGSDRHDTVEYVLGRESADQDVLAALLVTLQDEAVHWAVDLTLEGSRDSRRYRIASGVQVKPVDVGLAQALLLRALDVAEAGLAPVLGQEIGPVQAHPQAEAAAAGAGRGEIGDGSPLDVRGEWEDVGRAEDVSDGYLVGVGLLLQVLRLEKHVVHREDSIEITSWNSARRRTYVSLAITSTAFRDQHWDGQAAFLLGLEEPRQRIAPVDEGGRIVPVLTSTEFRSLTSYPLMEMLAEALEAQGVGSSREDREIRANDVIHPWLLKGDPGDILRLLRNGSGGGDLGSHPLVSGLIQTLTALGVAQPVVAILRRGDGMRRVLTYTVPASPVHQSSSQRSQVNFPALLAQRVAPWFVVPQVFTAHVPSGQSRSQRIAVEVGSRMRLVAEMLSKVDGRSLADAPEFLEVVDRAEAVDTALAIEVPHDRRTWLAIRVAMSSPYERIATVGRVAALSVVLAAPALFTLVPNFVQPFFVTLTGSALVAAGLLVSVLFVEWPAYRVLKKRARAAYELLTAAAFAVAATFAAFHIVEALYLAAIAVASVSTVLGMDLLQRLRFRQLLYRRSRQLLYRK